MKPRPIGTLWYKGALYIIGEIEHKTDTAIEILEQGRFSKSEDDLIKYSSQ
jgi:hypothetical protein